LQDALMRVVLLLMLFAFPQLRAAEEARHDMRELCRVEVSGTLLSALNDVDYLRGLIAQSEQKIKDTKAKFQLLDQQYHHMRKNTNEPVPVFELDEKVIALRFELQALREQIVEAEQHVRENREELAKREDFRKKFEQLVTPVFQTTRPKNTPPGAYVLRLEYKHPCGPYEILCPLPAEHAKHLRSIAEQLARPEWCERYSQIMPP